MVAFVFTACETGDGKGDGQNANLVRCANCDELKEWLVKSAIHEMYRQISYNRGGSDGLEDTDAPNDGGWDDDDSLGDDDSAGDDDSWDDDDDYAGDDDDSGQEGGSDDDDAGGSNHSDTNTQEDGVDEADIIKTDGVRLYVLSGDQLMIFDPSPPNLTYELSRFQIMGKFIEMFIYDDKVLVFSLITPEDLPDDVWVGEENLSYEILKLTIIDASVPTAPSLIREVYMEGSYLSSRRIDASVRIVVFSEPNGMDMETWVDTDEFCDWETGECDWDAIEQAYDDLAEENAEELEGRDLDDWLPRYHQVTYDAGGNPTHSDHLFADCQNNYHPQDPRGYGFLTIMTVMMTDPATKQPDIALIAEQGIVYGSTSSLVVAESQDMFWDWAWEESEGEEDSVPHSQIHMFQIDQDPTQASYLASGEVPGFLLNQFSLSQWDGHLRAAITSGDWNSSSFTNSVYVLQPSGNNLNVVGSVDLTFVEDWEEIKSARFIGDKGYVVTFEQTDPLFTLDLSDHTNPIEVGMLEIPGFSSYIHPMDDYHLLTVGETGDQWGSTGGISLQIFDISDFANPVLAHSYDIGEYWSSYSEAQYNHKAFLYYAHKPLGLDVLSIPVSYYDYGGWDDDDDFEDGPGVDPSTLPTDIDADFGITGDFSGFLVFNCNAQVGFNDPLFAADHTSFEPEQGSDEYWDLPYPLRSVVIGDYLFTLSETSLLVSSLITFESYTPIPLPYVDPWGYGYGDDDDMGMDDDDWAMEDEF